MCFLIFLIVSSLVAKSSGTCPKGAIQGLDASTCYLLKHYATGEPFFDDDEFCQRAGGRLASVHSAFENAFIKDIINVYPPANRLWIGGTTLVNGSWSWTDGTPFSYTNWGSGQPSGGGCVQMEVTSGVWEARDCFGCGNALMPVCKVPAVSEAPQPSCPTAAPLTQPHCAMPCPEDWAFYPPTSSCFKEAPKGVFYDVLSSCQNINASLASIHGLDVNRFVASYFASKEYSSSNSVIWLGLYNPQRNHDWQWTDGSSVNFTNWRAEQPDGDGYCVNMYGDPTLIGQWNDLPCTDELTGVCEKPAYYG